MILGKGIVVLDEPDHSDLTAERKELMQTVEEDGWPGQCIMKIAGSAYSNSDRVAPPKIDSCKGRRL
jgi:hypothetical protein